MLQYWIQRQGLKVLVIFEGRGSAGKGGVIKRITERTSPRTVRVVALPKPTERERTQWYFQRYVEHLPAAGEMVLFDRSWYNRSNVEWVMGYCTEEEHQEFLRSCPEFERMLVRSGITVLKYWFSVSLRGAAPALRGAQRRAAEALEALRHGPRRARAVRALLDGQGHDLPVHRHQAGALVRRPLRRQAGLAAQLHQPPAEPVRLRGRRARRGGAARDARDPLRAARRCTSRRSCRSCSDRARGAGTGSSGPSSPATGRRRRGPRRATTSAGCPPPPRPHQAAGWSAPRRRAGARRRCRGGAAPAR